MLILCNGKFYYEVNVEEDAEFLKLVIYKHLFSHVDMSKSYSSIELNDGLYRIGL